MSLRVVGYDLFASVVHLFLSLRAGPSPLHTCRHEGQRDLACKQHQAASPSCIACCARPMEHCGNCCSRPTRGDKPGATQEKLLFVSHHVRVYLPQNAPWYTGFASAGSPVLFTFRVPAISHETPASPPTSGVSRRECFGLRFGLTTVGGRKDWPRR